MTMLDPFDLEQVGPPRDRYGRPLLVPPNGGEREAFTRMSTLAGFICDDFGLSTWQQRLLAIGMSRREDLCAMVATLPELNDARCDKRSLTKAQREQDCETKAKLDEYIELALEAAGRNYKANSGTAIHGFVEAGSSEHAPERMQADVMSCLQAFRDEGIEVIASEQFVVNDELHAAGSFDHLVRTRHDGVVVLDIKSGQIEGKGLQFGVQLAGYANGLLYDWHDDSRHPLESLTGGERVNRSIGLLCHVPLGGGRTDLYQVNLLTGRHAARLATQVRRAREVGKTFLAPYMSKET
jgi:hypothetical protein